MGDIGKGINTVVYETIKRRLWWILLFLAILIIVGITNNLDGQDIEKLNYIYYNDGFEMFIGDEPVAFIYGKQAFGFKDGGFQAVLITGDTLEIKLKRKL